MSFLRLGLLAAFFVCFGIETSVALQVEEHSFSVPLKQSDIHTELSFPKFAKDGATLLRTEFVLRTKGKGTVRIENMDTEPTDTSSSVHIDTSLSLLNGKQIGMVSPKSSIEHTLAPHDGAVDFLGPSGKTFTNITFDETSTVVVDDSSVLQAFVGYGAVTLKLDASGRSESQGGANFVLHFALSTGIDVTVRYVYGFPDAHIHIFHDAPFTVGEEGLSTILIENKGEGNIAGVTEVSGVIPLGLRPKSIGGRGWTCTVGMQFACIHREVALPGLSLPPLMIVSHTERQAYPGVTLQAQVVAERDTNAENDYATDSIAVRTVADMLAAVSVQSSGSSQSPFSTRVTFRNRGPHTVQNADTFFQFPLALQSISWRCIPSPRSSCSKEEGIDMPQDLRVSLPVGGEVKVVFTGVIPPSLRGVLGFSASITPPDDIIDSDLTNNRAEDTLQLSLGFFQGTVPTGPDSIGKSCGNATLDYGEECDDGNQNSSDGCSNLCAVEYPETLRISQPQCGAHVSHASATLVSPGETLFVFVPDRTLDFSDTHENEHWRFIEFLKKTRIRAHSDFVIGGSGNHSSEDKGSSEHRTFPFEPHRPLSRLELAKVALITNGIPIQKFIRTDRYQFSDLVTQDTESEVDNWTARIMYTAAFRDVIQGFPDGTSRPFAPANNAEILAVLLRAANAIPRAYSLASVQNWYDDYVSFAKQNNLVTSAFNPQGFMHRDRFAKLVADVMALNPHPGISGYIEQVDIRNQRFRGLQLLSRPIPLLEGFVPQEFVSCQERAVQKESCLLLAQKAPVVTDIPEGHFAKQEIDFVLRTSLRESGETLMSPIGLAHFAPQQQVTVRDALIVALRLACVPRPMTDTDILNAAYQKGIIKKLYPLHRTATRTEVLTFLLAATHAIPEDYRVRSSTTFSDTFGKQQLTRIAQFAVENGIIAPQSSSSFGSYLSLNRTELAQMVVAVMPYSTNLGVRAYRTASGPLLR